jgi:hypothetical protein
MARTPRPPHPEPRRGRGGPTAADVAKRITAESGNAFHCRVASAFRERGWSTLLSPYYVDAASEKAREIDLVAEKTVAVAGESSEPKSVCVRLHVECKYVVQPTVFWFDARDDERAYAAIESRTPLRRTQRLARVFHQLAAGRHVAKLFASDHQRAADNDPVFRAVNQVLNGLIQGRSMKPLTESSAGGAALTLDYPLILCSSFQHFFRTEVENGPDPTPIDGNFLLEVNYAYLNRNGHTIREYFLADVVEFARFDAFEAAIEREMKALRLELGN